MVAAETRSGAALVQVDPQHSLAWIENGILVYGPRKAGTSLFQNLLDGGDDVLAYPAELKLKYFSRKLRSTKTAETYLAHSRVPDVQSEHLSIADYHKAWAELTASRRRHPVGDLIRHDAYALAKAVDKLPQSLSRWCAKEVGGGREDVIAYWRRSFPATKTLFMVRDPYAVLRAVIRDRHKKERPPTQRDVLKQVYDVYRTLRRQAKYLDDPDVHFTVFERLTENPLREMRRVIEFLGIPWSPIYSYPTMFGEPVVVRTASRASKEIFRSSDDWREGLTKSEQLYVERAMRWIRLAPGMALDYNRLTDRIAERQARTASVRVALAASV